MKEKSALKTKKLSDKELKKLFENYYLEFRTPLYWYILRKVGKPELAEDITADAFMKLLSHMEIIEERKKNEVKAWLYTVSRNQVIDYYRKVGGKTQKVELEEEFFEVMASDEENHLDILAQDEEYQIVLAAMESLTGEEREIINLRFKEEMQFSEIAGLLGKNEGAIKMTLYRALTKLKEMTGDRINYEDGIAK